MLDQLWRDLRYALRGMYKSPGFSTIAILSLGVGIGANTTIFTGVNALLLKPIPHLDEQEQLFAVYTSDERLVSAGVSRAQISALNYRDIHEQSETFQDLAAYFGAGGNTSVDGSPISAGETLVSPNYFDLLGVRPHLGTLFRGDEITDGAHPVAVISHGLWEGSLNADSEVVGKTIHINSFPFTVIGVTPPGFKGTQTLAQPSQVWIPMSMRAQMLPPNLVPVFDQRRGLFLNVVGRLEEGVSEAQARDELELIGNRLQEAYPEDNRGREFTLAPLSEDAVGINQRDTITRGGTMLLGTVGLVLLIACVNIANLLLARGGARGKEMGIRTALGASRGRVLTQLLTESVALAVIGGALGVLLSLMGTKILWAARPSNIGANVLDISTDLRILGFTAAITLFTGVLFGLFPALKVSKTDVQGSLKAEGRGGSQGTGRGAFQKGLVTAEVALAVVALTGTGLFVRSMTNAINVDAGFDIDPLIVSSVNISSIGASPEGSLQLFQSIHERVEALPGVEASSFSGNFPFGGSFMRTVIPEELQNDPDRPQVLSHTNVISPNYFETNRIPLLQGRTFTDFDRADLPSVTVVNEAAAETYWPGESPIGKRFNFIGQNIIREVVGVVGNTIVVQVDEEPQPVVYLPLSQNFQNNGVLFIRAADGVGSDLVTDVVTAVQELDPRVSMAFQSSARDLLSQGLWGRRIAAALLGVFGALALALASIGLYGVMAFSTSRRKREIGIRMAIGADAGLILRMVLFQGLGMTFAGVAVGLFGATVGTRWVESLLFGVSPLDPVTFGLAPAVLVVVATLAIYLPARRAARTSPIVAFREE